MHPFPTWGPLPGGETLPAPVWKAFERAAEPASVGAAELASVGAAEFASVGAAEFASVALPAVRVAPAPGFGFALPEGASVEWAERDAPGGVLARVTLRSGFVVSVFDHASAEGVIAAAAALSARARQAL